MQCFAVRFLIVVLMCSSLPCNAAQFFGDAQAPVSSTKLEPWVPFKAKEKTTTVSSQDLVYNRLKSTAAFLAAGFIVYSIAELCTTQKYLLANQHVIINNQHVLGAKLEVVLHNQWVLSQMSADQLNAMMMIKRAQNNIIQAVVLPRSRL